MVSIRRDIWELENEQAWHPITLAYANAVRALRRTAIGDVSIWAYQAAIHGTTCRPNRPAWNDCRHASWHFFPWHRQYLYWFERIVRSVVVQQGGPSDWALPYWDYSKEGQTDSLPWPFRQRLMPDGNTRNPLFVRQRAPGINDGDPLDPLITKPLPGAMNLPNFVNPPSPSFGGGITDDAHFWEEAGSIESTPHDVIHGAVGGPFGGWMADPMLAAQDPIFYLHHANIDRLWAEWSGAHAQPTDPRWLDKEFTFLDETGASKTRKVSGFLDIQGQLDYTYTPAGVPAPPPGPEAPTPSRPAKGSDVMPEMLGATDEGLTLTGAAETINVALDPLPEGVREAMGPSPRVLMSLEHIDADEPPGTVYAVFVALPDSPNLPQHVGNVTVFGPERLRVRDDDAEGPHERRLVFDVTDALPELRDPTAGVKDVSVTFQPVGLRRRSDEAFSEREVAQAPPLRLGRVSFFIE